MTSRIVDRVPPKGISAGATYSLVLAAGLIGIIGGCAIGYQMAPSQQVAYHQGGYDALGQMAHALKVAPQDLLQCISDKR